ncbi:MAG: YlxR family protein [Clostridia bacterium]|nr:YlxR family protein [Clostridia bacterium]
MKKIPERTCMGCNQKKDKSSLIRIVKNKEKGILIDKTGKLEGRGAYICNNINCLDKAIKSKRIDRKLETNISEEIYNKLRGVIIDKQ